MTAQPNTMPDRPRAGTGNGLIADVDLGERLDALLAKRDEAFARLTDLEAKRAHLALQVHGGDKAAEKELNRTRSQIARQSALAADLDAAVDVAHARIAEADGSAAAVADDSMASIVRELGARRLELAREIEGHVESVAEAYRRMLRLTDEFRLAGLANGPLGAELNRFRDRFGFYLETMLDFVGGSPVHCSHPHYRRLAALLLDGDALASLRSR